MTVKGMKGIRLSSLRKERWAGYGACIAALGLGITHIVANLGGYLHHSAQQPLFMVFIWAVLPSLLFFVFGWAVLALVHFWGGKRWSQTWLILTWIVFVLMSLQFIWLLILGFLRKDFIGLYHIGPGPWSVFGSFLFGFTLWQVHRKITNNNTPLEKKKDEALSK